MLLNMVTSARSSLELDPMHSPSPSEPAIVTCRSSTRSRKPGSSGSVSMAIAQLPDERVTMLWYMDTAEVLNTTTLPDWSNQTRRMVSSASGFSVFSRPMRMPCGTLRKVRLSSSRSPLPEAAEPAV
jgi:hypothetical protein